MLYSGASFKDRATSGVAYKLSGMQLVDAVESSLEVDNICDLLKDEASSCEGVAFRHYSGGKSWKSVPGERAMLTGRQAWKIRCLTICLSAYLLRLAIEWFFFVC